ncbi:hypothetical protein CVT26_002425 [Gymnopilus dilepis]|uniref:DUF4100 domain-containing protein n=1 Tax=Gymnopilus dilepis TaxID=231916 RepID=A0A409WEA0_9AGAR|nr:hypothetical protein CVT26_002425 [Gymnopilus dilepis]
MSTQSNHISAEEPSQTQEAFTLDEETTDQQIETSTIVESSETSNSSTTASTDSSLPSSTSSTPFRPNRESSSAPYSLDPSIRRHRLQPRSATRSLTNMSTTSPPQYTPPQYPALPNTSQSSAPNPIASTSSQNPQPTQSQNVLASHSSAFAPQSSFTANAIATGNPLVASGIHYPSHLTGPAAMPIRGSSKAPKTFRGHYSRVEQFLNHLDRLFTHHQVISDADKVELILDYCSTAVQNFIKTTEGYKLHNWAKLKKTLKESFDADRKETRYDIGDLVELVKESSRKLINKLEKWKKYVVDYQTIAGSLMSRGRLSQFEYDSYFWSGIHPDLRTAFQPMLLISFQTHDTKDPYKLEEVDQIAQKYFKRDRFSDIIPNIFNWKERSDSESESEYDSDSSSSDSDSDSDYHRRRKKKKSSKRKGKGKAKDRRRRTKDTIDSTKAEVDGLIDRINRMTLLNMNRQADQNIHSHQHSHANICSHCGENSHQVYVANTMPTGTNMPVAQPFQHAPPLQHQTYSQPMNTQPFVTYPNNIPLSSNTGNMRQQQPPQPPFKCFGCNSLEHMLGECPRMHELMQQGVLDHDPKTRKFCLKHSRIPVYRRPGETLYEAALRLNSIMPPLNRPQNANLVTILEENQSEAAALKATRERISKIPSRPSKEVFDGVYPPPRKMRKPILKERASTEAHAPEASTSQANKENVPPHPTSTTGPTLADEPEKPESFDTRRLRENQDIPMADLSEPVPRKVARSIPRDSPRHASASREKQVKIPARQSEISREVDTHEVVKEILDTPITIPIRKIIGSSKEIATDLQDIIKLRNNRALSAAVNNSQIAHEVLALPKGRLIKIPLSHKGQALSAIVDTGSEINIISPRLVYSLQLPINVARQITMTNANGNSNVLRGLAEDVELNCGHLKTTADIWLGNEDLPYDLLLGRTWQRENLVSTEERPTGTYIVFRDQHTGSTRYSICVNQSQQRSQAPSHYFYPSALIGAQAYLASSMPNAEDFDWTNLLNLEFPEPIPELPLYLDPESFSSFQDPGSITSLASNLNGSSEMVNNTDEVRTEWNHGSENNSRARNDDPKGTEAHLNLAEQGTVHPNQSNNDAPRLNSSVLTPDIRERLRKAQGELRERLLNARNTGLKKKYKRLHGFKQSKTAKSLKFALTHIRMPRFVIPIVGRDGVTHTASLTLTSLRGEFVNLARNPETADHAMVNIKFPEATLTYYRNGRFILADGYAHACFHISKEDSRAYEMAARLKTGNDDESYEASAADFRVIDDCAGPPGRAQPHVSRSVADVPMWAPPPSSPFSSLPYSILETHAPSNPTPLPPNCVAWTALNNGRTIIPHVVATAENLKSRNPPLPPLSIQEWINAQRKPPLFPDAPYLRIEDPLNPAWLYDPEFVCLTPDEQHVLLIALYHLADGHPTISFIPDSLKIDGFIEGYFEPPNPRDLPLVCIRLPRMDELFARASRTWPESILGIFAPIVNRCGPTKPNYIPLPPPPSRSPPPRPSAPLNLPTLSELETSRVSAQDEPMDVTLPPIRIQSPSIASEPPNPTSTTDDPSQQQPAPMTAHDAPQERSTSTTTANVFLSAAPAVLPHATIALPSPNEFPTHQDLPPLWATYEPDTSDAYSTDYMSSEDEDYTQDVRLPPLPELELPETFTANTLRTAHPLSTPLNADPTISTPDSVNATPTATPRPSLPTRMPLSTSTLNDRPYLNPPTVSRTAPVPFTSTLTTEEPSTFDAEEPPPYNLVSTTPPRTTLDPSLVTTTFTMDAGTPLMDDTPSSPLTTPPASPERPTSPEPLLPQFLNLTMDDDEDASSPASLAPPNTRAETPVAFRTRSPLIPIESLSLATLEHIRRVFHDYRNWNRPREMLPPVAERNDENEPSGSDSDSMPGLVSPSASDTSSEEREVADVLTPQDSTSRELIRMEDAGTIIKVPCPPNVANYYIAGFKPFPPSDSHDDTRWAYTSYNNYRPLTTIRFHHHRAQLAHYSREFSKLFNLMVHTSRITFGQRRSLRHVSRIQKALPPRLLRQHFSEYDTYALLEQDLLDRGKNGQENRWKAQLNRIKQLRHTTTTVLYAADRLLKSYGYTDGLREYVRVHAINPRQIPEVHHPVFHPFEIQYFVNLSRFLYDYNVLGEYHRINSLLSTTFHESEDLQNLCETVVKRLVVPAFTLSLEYTKDDDA